MRDYRHNSRRSARERAAVQRFFQKRDRLPALAVANDLVQRQPGVARLESLLIATLSNLKRYDEAIARAAHFYTGKIDDAIRFDQRAVELNDAAACHAAPDVTVIDPEDPPSGPNVISFSLWGSRLIYCYGAMINLSLSRTVYPGWSCRYYVDAAVPRRCVAYLRENGAEVFKIPLLWSISALSGDERP
jgi:hypothetical protein